MLWSILDIAEYSCRALLLLYLCANIIDIKEKYRSCGKVFFFLQAVIANYWLANSEWAQKALHSEDMSRQSSYSIVRVLILFGCSYFFMEMIYQGRKAAKLYLLTVFYTIQEMARFALHGIWILGMNVYIGHLTEKAMEGQMTSERFYTVVERWEYWNYLLYAVGYLFLMAVSLFFYKRYCREKADEIGKQGLVFLMLSPVIGMVFDVALRVSFYTQTGNEIELIYDKHGSMYAVIPVIAVLCLISIVYSRKIYSDLMKTEEEKKNLLFYKQQLADMTTHVKEMEQLYDGIRGMRHDVNNYVQDMEQLLRSSIGRDGLPDGIEKEAKQYLHGMEQAVAGLFCKFSTGNPVTDVILNRKGQICEQEQIALEENFFFPSDMGIEAFDIGILLNNALDNAIEACRKMPDGAERFLAVRSYCKGRMFFLTVENSLDKGQLIEENGELRTTKKDKDIHGIGMNNMRSCAEKYYGTIQYRIERDRFYLDIMLQGTSGQLLEQPG